MIDGPLANLTGVFIRAAARNVCIFTIDEERGVNVILAVTSLELANVPTFDASDQPAALPAAARVYSNPAQYG